MKAPVLKLLFAATVLLLTACQKQPVPAPASGSNTLECHIDGRYFVPYIAAKDQPFSGPPIKPLKTGYNRKAHTLFISGQTTTESIEFYADVTQGTGTYQLGYSAGSYPYTLTPSNYGGYELVQQPAGGNLIVHWYTTNALHTGSVSITSLDTVARFANGTFAYTAQDAVTGQLTRITDGQFSVTF
jgi:hypothetical protein